MRAYTDSLGEAAFQRGSASRSTSLVNPTEAELIVALLHVLDGSPDSASWIEKQTEFDHPIGIICTYAAQAEHLRRLVTYAPFGSRFRQSVKIDTVDSYQGKQNPLVILSLVRNNADGVWQRGVATIREGFMARPNRINVAMSRAMDRLVIVGAKTRWRQEAPMGRVSSEFDNQVSSGNGRVIHAEELLNRPKQAKAGARQGRKADANRTDGGAP